MSVYFIADTHFFHKRILEFSNQNNTRQWGCETVEEHNQELLRRINSVVKKRDKLYILGDVVFGSGNLYILGQIDCQNVEIVLGNHDTEYHPPKEFYGWVDKICAVKKYKGYWLTHVPIHPNELRGCKNIHGHVHHNTVRGLDGKFDKRYINISEDPLDGYPISYEDIRSGKYWETQTIEE